MPLLALITAISIAILSPAQRAAGTPRFVSLEGRFSISLPDRAGSRKLTITTPFGDAYGDVYEWEAKEGNFGIGYGDSIRPINDPEAVKQFFDGATERFRSLAVANGGNSLTQTAIGPSEQSL